MRPRLRSLTACVALVLASGVAHAAPDKPVVAVFTIEGKEAKLSARTLGNLTEYLAAALGGTGRYQIIATSELRERLGQTKAASYRACFDQACQIELGKELAAEKSLSTRVMRIGRQCVVTTNLFDLRRATTDRSSTREGPCTEDGVMASVKALVEDLAGAVKAEEKVAVAKAEVGPNRLAYWTSVDGGDYEERDGAIVGSAGILVSKSSGANTTIELDAELIGGADQSYVSVGWRAGGAEGQKPTRAYASGFEWTGTYHMFVAVGGSWRSIARDWAQNVPWKPTKLVHPKKNHLRIEAIGAKYEIYVNEQLLDSGTDPTHTSGKFYLACGNGGMCRLSNIKLTPRD